LNKFWLFKDLPDDMQVLLFELVERVAGEPGLQKLDEHSFRVWVLPITVFSSVPLLTDYRDEQYTFAMIGKLLPPVVVHGNKWIDGRHRVWALKESGASSVECINLNVIFPDYPYEPTGILSCAILQQTSAAILETKALERISKAEAVDFDLADIQPKERRQVLQTVNRKIRDARFRANVLRAYSHRCCVCGVQLDLLDAAHIIPVEHERGTDEIKNGLSLCALHHRAFDHALIGIRTDYTIACSEKEFQRLRSIGWHGGESEFKAALRDQILLPPKKGIYPAPGYLEFGQKLRGWAN
jgi:hypothetical protein